MELLDEDTFPSNSDAVLMISQFKSAMEQYKQKYYTLDNNVDFDLLEEEEYSWKIKD